MSRFLYGFYVVGLAVLSALTFVKAEHPPHAAPAAAQVPVHEVIEDYSPITDYLEFQEGVKRAFEEAAQAEAARVEAARRAPVVGPVSAGASPDCDSIPEWFPHSIAWRESNCRRGIATGNGYYGYAQVAGFHWFGGICDGLTWTDPAQEDECVDRLSQHGTRLSPWGF